MDKVSAFAKRAYKKVTRPYRQLWGSNKWIAIAIPVITAIGIPFSAGFVLSGLTFSDYWSAVSGGAQSVVDTGLELKERAVWECGPGFAVCYAIQPNGWSWNDMESIQTLQSMTGVTFPIAKYEWFSPLMENPALILPSSL